MCGDWDRAEDLLQTAFGKLYVAWPRMREHGHEEAYVRRILINTNIDESRRPWHRRERSIDFALHDRSIETGLGIEDRSAVIEALQALPAMQRRVLVLRHMYELSVAETAAELGIRQGTVKSHTSRGLASLSEALRAWEVEHDPRSHR